VIIPITFPPVVIPIAPTFPISIPVNLGGVKIGEINLSFNGTFEVNFNEPAKEQKDYAAILQKILDCACKDSPQPPATDTIQIPFAKKDSDGTCVLSSARVVEVAGSLSPADADLLNKSAQLALAGCSAATPPQKQEVLIFSGTSTEQVQLFHSPSIDKDVVALRLKITQTSQQTLLRGDAYPTAQQRKYGVIGFNAGGNGGGEEREVFDSDFYFRLPVRFVAGIAKVLLKPGQSFSLYDTGERLR
jgi:hypothetical protein